MAWFSKRKSHEASTTEAVEPVGPALPRPSRHSETELPEVKPVDVAATSMAGRIAVEVAPGVTISTPGPGKPANHKERWYVPAGDDKDRFVGKDGGMPPLHLINYSNPLEDDDYRSDEALRLCEDSTGLLVGPTDRRLPAAGIWVAPLRGESYHKAACRSGDFSPGARVRLKREPDNPHDPNAIAITADRPRAGVVGYVNKLKARAMAKLIDSGTVFEAISVSGTPAGEPCEQIAVLAAAPDVLAHLLSPRPDGLPAPAHLRSQPLV